MRLDRLVGYLKYFLQELEAIISFLNLIFEGFKFLENILTS